MYISKKTELKQLNQVAEYFISKYSSINWIPTTPDCKYEIKSEALFNKEEATNLCNQIKENEAADNQKAINVFESRTSEGMWRIVISLEGITL